MPQAFIWLVGQVNSGSRVIFKGKYLKNILNIPDIYSFYRFELSYM